MTEKQWKSFCDFKNGIREGEGTMTYGETGNKYEGE